MKTKTNLLILTILILGLMHKFFITSGGNFLFNMDNARDLVDVREMVVLQKVRLIGPTSAIEGLFNGPAWYYLLVVPFVLTSGDPYGAIVFQFVTWAIGGFFLLKIVQRFSKWLIIPIGLIWISSEFITLTTIYSFNPNPVTHLTPLFIYLLDKYLEKGKLIFGVSALFLGGLFFNFEMNFGIFIPAVVVVSMIFSKRTNLIRTKSFFLSIGAFILTLLPQIFFDLRHDFLMINSVINYLRQGTANTTNILQRVTIIPKTFYDVYLPIMLNQKLLTNSILILGLLFSLKILKERLDRIVIISLCYIFIPLISYILLPVNVNSWHVGGAMVAGLILTAYLLKRLAEVGNILRFISIIIVIIILYFSLIKISDSITDSKKINLDPSRFYNEIKAIDYVYKLANGENFKVYTYLPSVIDYSNQYLFWWYGKKTYGYIPYDYAYSPNKPQYISNKQKFEGSKENYRGLVFLIKEPDRIQLRDAWEDDYDEMELISKEIVGPYEIEMKREVRKP